MQPLQPEPHKDASSVMQVNKISDNIPCISKARFEPFHTKTDHGIPNDTNGKKVGSDDSSQLCLQVLWLWVVRVAGNKDFFFLCIPFYCFHPTSLFIFHSSTYVYKQEQIYPMASCFCQLVTAAHAYTTTHKYVVRNPLPYGHSRHRTCISVISIRYECPLVNCVTRWAHVYASVLTAKL